MGRFLLVVERINSIADIVDLLSSITGYSNLESLTILIVVGAIYKVVKDILDEMR